nr:hypothetical protein [Desulfobacterales bacterium]
MKEKVQELMRGACDLHIHAGPDVVPRVQDVVEVARDSREAGMRALGIKDHNTNTADRCYVASQMVPGIELLGGIVLNHTVGGLNPETVEKAIKLGTKIIWMPSLDAALTIQKVHVTQETPWLEPFVTRKDPKEGISIFKGGMEGDEILPEVRDILRLIAEANVILDTCHLGAREALALVKEAKEIGVERIIVCHPNCSVNLMPIDVQKELAGLGALLSYAFLPCMPLFDRQDFRDIAKMIKEVGPENAIFFTDFGQLPNPTAVEGVRMFISSLLALGFKDNEVKAIASENYKRVLD